MSLTKVEQGFINEKETSVINGKKLLLLGKILKYFLKLGRKRVNDKISRDKERKTSISPSPLTKKQATLGAFGKSFIYTTN